MSLALSTRWYAGVAARNAARPAAFRNAIAAECSRNSNGCKCCELSAGIRPIDSPAATRHRAAEACGAGPTHLANTPSVRARTEASSRMAMLPDHRFCRAATNAPKKKGRPGDLPLKAYW